MAAATELKLPERFVRTDHEQALTFERALFNNLLDLCDELGLGMRTDELERCKTFLISLRDALQVRSVLVS